MRRRNWMFTQHLDGEQPEESVAASFVPSSERVRCAVWQLERCPTTERLHYQGYVEFTVSMRMGAVKEILQSSNVHLEPRNGSREQAYEYCRKDDTRVAGPWTVGDFGSIRPGKRTDLDECAQRILAGDSLDSIVEEHPVHYIRYRRGIEALVYRRAKRRCREFRQLTVLVYYGDAGTGKTRRAVENADGDYFILDEGERVWFDGYDGEGTLIIDDFSGWIKYRQLLRILDGYSYRCEIKGGFTWAEWTRVIVTSNKAPEDWYSYGMTPELRRRITTIEHFSELVNHN